MKLDHILPSANVFEVITILDGDFDQAIATAQSLGFWQGMALAFGLALAAIIAVNIWGVQKHV